jgi:hypothetical protein
MRGRRAGRAFDPGVGRDDEEVREREIEKLHAKIGQLTVERVFLSQEVRKMSAPHCRALLASDHGRLSIRRQCRLLGVAITPTRAFSSASFSLQLEGDLVACVLPSCLLAGEIVVGGLCRLPLRQLRASRRSGGDQSIRELHATDAEQNTPSPIRPTEARSSSACPSCTCTDCEKAVSSSSEESDAHRR